METKVSQTATTETMVANMNQFLADLHIFYQNLRAFHWNVKGNMFFVLHEKFEEYYNETSEQIDEVAERILMVGGQPFHTMSDYLAHTKLEEFVNVRDGITAVTHVVAQTDVLYKQMVALQAEASELGDEATCALFGDMISSTEKRQWMLRTFLA